MMFWFDSSVVRALIVLAIAIAAIGSCLSGVRKKILAQTQQMKMPTLPPDDDINAGEQFSWHHLKVTASGSNHKIYLDGIEYIKPDVLDLKTEQDAVAQHLIEDT